MKLSVSVPEVVVENVDVAITVGVDELEELELDELNEVEVLLKLLEVDDILEVLVAEDGDVVLTELLVVDAAVVVAVPPQTMFNDTARGVAYTVGLELELAADEA